MLIVGLSMAATCVAVASASAAQPPAQLRGFVCERAIDPSQRAVGVEAVMRAISGTRRMALRLELLVNSRSGTSWSEVSGGDLGRWESPSNPPTLGQRRGDRWIYDKEVTGLQRAPASYRFRATFKWIGARGRIVAREVRLSRTCLQPELRPDLLVKSIAVRQLPHKPGMAEYVAVIRNAGATATGPFEVRFTDGLLVQEQAVTDLAGGSSLRARFDAPTCTSGTVTVSADPQGQVDDYDRANNSLSMSCSTAAGH